MEFVRGFDNEATVFDDGDEHPPTPTSGTNLASSLLKQGKHAEAEQINKHRQALIVFRSNA
jgi:hypothetical protein